MPSAGNPKATVRLEKPFQAAVAAKSERTGIAAATVMRVALERFMAQTDEESIAEFLKKD